MTLIALQLACALAAADAPIVPLTFLFQNADGAAMAEQQVRVEYLNYAAGEAPPAIPGRTWNLTTDAEGRATLEGAIGDYCIEVDGHIFKPRIHSAEQSAVTLRLPGLAEPPAAFELPFAAATAEEARVWQEQVRARLREIVAAQNPKQDHPLDVELVGEWEEMGSYRRRTVHFEGNEGQRVEATLTVPDGDGPFPAMVCLHGHGGSREMVHDSGSIYHGLAAEFATRGFVTLAPSLEHREYAPNHLWNLKRLVDVLETLEYVDEGRIGAAGLSMGGEWTMWLSVMDPRIKAAVVSGWMCTTEGVLSIRNCPCWMPPGLRELCDIAEVHILFAPRPMLFESAVEDGCFPIRTTEEGFAKIRRGYEVMDAGEKVKQHTFPGGHAWNGGQAYDFIERALKG